MRPAFLFVVAVCRGTVYDRRMPTMMIPLAYAEGFLTECMDAGLSKDASMILLEKADLNWKMTRVPGYREGWEEVIKSASDEPSTAGAVATGALTAASIAGLLLARKPILRQAVAAAKQTKRGIDWAAQGQPFVADAATWAGHNLIKKPVEYLWQKHEALPGSAKFAGAAATAGGIGGLIYANDAQDHAWVNKLPNRSGSGYDGPSAASQFQRRLNASTAGLGRLNTELYGKTMRAQELEHAVSTGAPGASDAVMELQRLRKDIAMQKAQIGSARSGIQSDLRHQAEYAQKIGEQMGTEIDRDNSTWTKFRRFLGDHKLPGGMRDNGEYYQNRVAKLQAEGLDNFDDSRAALEATRRLDNHIYNVAPTPSAPTPNVVSDLLR